MLYTIVDINDIFYDEKKVKRGVCRSSNPYDYIRTGYYLDNAALYEGVSNVNLNSDFSSYFSGYHPNLPFE